jgi:uncharacterized protein (TIGR03084 family)
MSVDVGRLLEHLDAETQSLTGVLRGLDASGWATPTPSPGWCVADQVSHLAYFDEAAAVAICDPHGFARYRDEVLRLGSALPDDVAARYRDTAPAELLESWSGARRAMADAVRRAPPSLRAPWYGPDLSVPSMVSGRIMETWAHGQDVFDACGLDHPVTDALYDVARLCARTRANSYAAHGRSAPDGDVVVELDAPDGTTWRFGEVATDRIGGDAVEFCLVATQRRHVADTRLVATGALASEWLSLAQAYAGPAGSGRAESASGR